MEYFLHQGSFVKNPFEAVEYMRTAAVRLLSAAGVEPRQQSGSRMVFT